MDAFNRITMKNNLNFGNKNYSNREKLCTESAE